MWNKIRIIADCDRSAMAEHSVSNYGVVSFGVPDGGAKVKSITVYGERDDSLPMKNAGIGYNDENGQTHLFVRAHGANIMDGHELVRLMIASDSPAYGGEYDDEHFLYNCSAPECTVVSGRHFALFPQAHTFKMTADLEEDVVNGGKLSPGLYFKLPPRSPVAISAASSGVGAVEMTAKTPFGYLVTDMIHKPTGITAQIPIRYDSVRLYVGAAVGNDPYVGESVDFHLGTPLYADYYDDIYDELECISGTVTRNIMAWDIEDDVTVTKVYYEGYPCFSVPLPTRAGGDFAEMDEFTYSSDSSDFELECTLCFVGPDREHAYFYLVDDISAEEAREYIVGNRLLYLRSEPEIIKLDSTISAAVTGGEFYVEVCDAKRPTVDLIYIAKE